MHLLVWSILSVLMCIACMITMIYIGNYVKNLSAITLHQFKGPALENLSVGHFFLYFLQVREKQLEYPSCASHFRRNSLRLFNSCNHYPCPRPAHVAKSWQDVGPGPDSKYSKQ